MSGIVSAEPSSGRHVSPLVLAAFHALQESPGKTGGLQDGAVRRRALPLSPQLDPEDHTVERELNYLRQVVL